MRRIVYVQTRQEAQTVARWACCFARVGAGAWMCFESATDYASYRRGS